MEKPFYKAIILVLASDNQPLYRFFKRVYEQYLDKNSNIRVFFTYGQGTKFERKPYDLVYDDLKETIITPWMTTKVTRAMEHIDTNYDYDYLVRTNMSTFWDFEKLLKRLESLPSSRCLAGHYSIFEPRFITGIAMVLSRDVVKQMIANQHMINIKYDKYKSEDSLLSNFVTHNNHAEMINQNHFTRRFESYTKWDEAKVIADITAARTREVDNYRIKSVKADRNEIDTKIAVTLLKMIYDIDMEPNLEI